MTSQSERPPNPNDLSYYAPPGLRERAKSLSQEARSDSREASPTHSLLSPSPDDEIKKPVYLRRPPVPELVQKPDRLAPQPQRAAPFGAFRRFGVIAAVVIVVALLVGLILAPASRQSAARTPPEVTGAITPAISKSSQQEDGSKSALAAFQGILATAPASQPSPPEPQLLQQFLQWRDKAIATETSNQGTSIQTSE